MTARGYWTMAPHDLFQGPRFEALSALAQACFLWLAVGPRNVRALYNLPPGLARATAGHIAGVLGHSVEEVRNALIELVEAEWIHAADGGEWIYIPGACRPADNAKHFSMVMKQATANLDATTVTRQYLADVICSTVKRAEGWKKDGDKLGQGEAATRFNVQFPGLLEALPPPSIPYQVPYAIQRRTDNVDLPHVELQEPQPSCSPAKPEDASTLLSVLHPTGDLFSVCGFGHRTSPTWEFFTDCSQAYEYALDLDSSGRFHTTAMGVSGIERPASGRGSESDAVSCHACWIDLDATDEDGRRDAGLAWTCLDNNMAAGRIPPPSAIVNSGHGLHAYWFLTTVATSDELALVKGVNLALAQRVGADACHDLSRVLRVPGTMNRKGADPVPCEVIELHADRRYGLDDLARQVEAQPMVRQLQSTRRDAVITPADAIPTEWAALLKQDPELLDIWERYLAPGDRSEPAMSLLSRAAHKGILDPADLAAIAHAAPCLGTWAAEKASALAATISKALDGMQSRGSRKGNGRWTT